MSASARWRLTIIAALTTVLCGGLATPATATTTPRTVGTIQLSPQAETLANPAQSGQVAAAQSFSPALVLLDTKGDAIPAGTPLTTPVTITIYGPTPAVLTTPATTITAATPTVTFDYDGGFAANSVFVTAVSGGAFAQMSFQPRHRGFPGTRSAPFTMPRDNVKHGWSFKISVGGGTSRTVLMDTGSHGIVVPTSALGPTAVGPGPAGQIEYSSDGKIFSGNDYLTPVTLTVGGTTVTTVPIKVLAISKASCDLVHFPTCKPGNPKGVGMLGVGFDRGKQTSSPSPSRAATPAAATPPELGNAVLALTDIVQGAMHPGYVITSQGVTLGITAANTAGFSTVSLTPGGTGPGDWNGAPGCFSLPGLKTYRRKCGSVLMDTGIASAILALPKAQRPASMKKKIPARTKVQITVGPTGAGAAQALRYGYTTGGAASVTPTSIRWAAGSPPFINTGRKVISRYDYLFDAGSGRLGFKRSP